MWIISDMFLIGILAITKSQLVQAACCIGVALCAIAAAISYAGYERNKK